LSLCRLLYMSLEVAQRFPCGRREKKKAIYLFELTLSAVRFVRPPVAGVNALLGGFPREVPVRGSEGRPSRDPSRGTQNNIPVTPFLWVILGFALRGQALAGFRRERVFGGTSLARPQQGDTEERPRGAFLWIILGFALREQALAGFRRERDFLREVLIVACLPYS
jgi:hypothetical protein